MSEDRRITMRLTRIENTLEEIKRNITAPVPPDRKITVREAAEIMHCSDQRVRDAIHDGSLKAERNGRRFFLSLYDVRARAGAYVSSDFHIVRAYPGKMYCWGINSTH